MLEAAFIPSFRRENVQQPFFPPIEIASALANLVGRLDAAFGSTVGLLADRHL